MTGLLSFILGLLLGLMLTRRLRPLLFERIRAWPVLVFMLLASLLMPLFDRFWPALLWTEDRALLLTFQVLPILLALFFILVNLLPDKRIESGRSPVRWYHRAALLFVAAGLMTVAAVLLPNHGYWPIPETYLASITDPVVAEGIRNQALLLKRLIGPETVLPRLGQVWHSELLTMLHLSLFPFISPGEVIIAGGLFLSGLSQFFGGHEDNG